MEAFLAQTDTDVTNAIADFMDCSIVIPPTDIQDPEMLKPVINYQRRILRDRLRPADARLAYGTRVKGQQQFLLYQDKLKSRRRRATVTAI